MITYSLLLYLQSHDNFVSMSKRIRRAQTFHRLQCIWNGA